MRPGNAQHGYPASDALIGALAQSFHNSSGNQAYRLKTIPSLGPAEVFLAELPPNLRALRRSPFLPRHHVDDLSHFATTPEVNLISCKIENGMERLQWSDKT